MNIELNKIIEIINSGGVILYPTDTVWGIGCDATNEEAVAKIFKLKQREATKSMITLVSGERMLSQIFNKIPEVAWQIIDFAENPTTLILDNPKNIAKNSIASDNSLAVRVTKDDFCCKLMEKTKKPLISTSANISGAPTPLSFKEITPEIIKGVDYVVNLHRNKKATKPSSIIKIKENNEVIIIRK